MMLPRNIESAAAAQTRSGHATGPVTDAGKHAVSFNSTKHNLTSVGVDRAALPGEEPEFKQFCREIREALAPVGPLEGALADDIAGDRWRLRRARNMENALFEKIERESNGSVSPSTAKAEAWIDEKRGLQRMAVYAARLQRSVEKNSAKLEAMQAERKAAQADAREEAVLLTQLADLESKIYEPGGDFLPASDYGGFVYSGSEIRALIDRNRRLTDAKSLFTEVAAKAA